MNRIFLLLVFLIAILSLKSQTQDLALKELIKEVNSLNNDFDSAKYNLLSNLTNNLILENRPETNLGDLASEWGFYYENNYQPDSARKFYELALGSYSFQQDSANMAVILYGLGGALYDLENYSKSADFYLKSLDMYKAVGTPLDVADVLNALGGVYYIAGDLEIAKDYFEESATIQGSIDNQEGVIMALGNLGAVHEYSDLDSAVYYYELAMGKALALNDTIQMVDMCTGLGLIMLKKEELDSAYDYFKKSLDVSLKLNSRSQLGYSYQNMAYYYQEIGNLNLTESYADLALEMSEELSDFQLRTNTLDILQEVYFNTNRYQLAYQTLNQVRNELDSVYDITSAKELSNIKGQYELALAENKVFQQNINDQSIQIERAQDLNVKILLGTALVIMFIITVIVLRNQQLQKRTNLLLQNRNEEIEEKNQKIQNLEKVRNKWFNNIAHELRTPLTLIKGPIEFMRKDKNLEEDSIEMLQIAHRNVGRLDKLTSEILDLSKIDDGQIKLRASVVDLGKSLKDLVDSFKAIAERDNVQVLFEKLDDPFYVKVDEEKLSQAVSSLISNGIKFSPEGGEVRIILKEEVDEIVICVDDDGDGIDKQDIARIFERYFQSDTATKSSKAGSGVGLSLCKEYTELHKGYVTVKSEVGQGSSFEIHLPSSVKIRGSEYEDLIEEASGDEKGKKPKLILNGKSIFISDDNSDMREYIMSFLQDKFSVKPFRDGKALLSELQHQVPDLIITDLMMPRMDGTSLIKKLKENEKYRSIPVIIISAVMEEQERLETLRLGIDDYITKPFNPEELVIRIENLLINYNERQSAMEFEDIEEKASFSEKLLKTLEEEIKANVADPNFNVIRLADAGSLSERQLYRYLKQTTGFTPGNFIKEIRLQKAFELARRNIYTTTSELAYAVGFQHPSYFSNVFKERFGKKPSEFFKEES